MFIVLYEGTALSHAVLIPKSMLQKLGYTVILQFWNLKSSYYIYNIIEQYFVLLVVDNNLKWAYF
jgi:hypothetical protein